MRKDISSAEDTAIATEQFSNGGQSTLVSAISATGTTLTVASASTFPTVPQFRIRIDDEIMIVTGVSGAVFTVTRAAESTTGATHAAGATVQHPVTAASIVNTPRGVGFLLCLGFTPAATGADVGEIMVPYDPKDGTTVLTYNVRRAWLRVNTPGGAPIAVVQKSSAGNATFGSGTAVATLTMPSGDSLIAVTASLGTIQSGDMLRFSVTALGTATGWTIGVEASN